MGGHKNLTKGTKIKICREEYELIKNLGALRGFQFRVWLLERLLDKKLYVAKLAQKKDRALTELKILFYLEKKAYPNRYYAKLEAFDDCVIYKGEKFCAMLLKYLPDEGDFQPLDEYLNGRPLNKNKRKIAEKLIRRIETLHSLSIIHGDIRKENIMVQVKKASGRIGVRLIDFGLSKFADKEIISEETEKLYRLIDKELL